MVKDKYDLTYKWNLINKTNKGEKYNQRHGNKEQTDSDERGGGREITGERRETGCQGTCIKDPWTKAMWGEDSWAQTMGGID